MSVIEKPADALAAMDRHDGVRKEGGDADDLAVGREWLETIFDRVREHQLLDRALRDLRGRTARENAVRNTGVNVLGTPFLAAVGHLDERSSGYREIIDDQDILAAH